MRGREAIDLPPPGHERPSRWKGPNFAWRNSVPPKKPAVLSAMLQELVDYRLAAYEVRLETRDGSREQRRAFPPRRRDAVELPYFPEPQDRLRPLQDRATDSEEHRALSTAHGPLDPSRHFIARATGNSMDGGKNPVRDGDLLLLELISPKPRWLDHWQRRGDRTAG
jgi:hypothetical protein